MTGSPSKGTELKLDVIGQGNILFADIQSGTPYNQTKSLSCRRTIFMELTKLYPTHACREFNEAFPLLAERCGYTEDTIPQLQDISDFLKGTVDGLMKGSELPIIRPASTSQNIAINIQRNYGLPPWFV